MNDSSPQQSQEIMRAMADLAPDAVLLFDQRGCISGWNKKAEEIFGYARSEVVGKSFFGFLVQGIAGTEPPNVIPESFFTQIGSKVGSSFELIAIRKSGERFPIELSVAPLKKDSQWSAISIVRDVSERKRIEQELADREQNLTVTLDSIADGVIVTDSDGRVIRMNPIAQQMTGWALVEARGRKFEEVFCLVDESVLVSKDGARCPVAKKGSPLKDAANGPMKGTVFVFRDVGQERAASKRMEEDLEKLSTLFNGIGDPVYVLEVSEKGPGKIIEVNQAACRLLGYSRTELLQLSVKDVDALELTPMPEGDVQRLLNGEIIRFCRPYMRKDGTVVPVELNFCLIDLLGRKLGLTVARDVTERLRAEEEKKKAEYKYGLLFENAADAILIISVETGLIEECNAASVRLFARSKSELLGRHHRFLYRLNQAPVYRDGVPFESQVVTATGETRDVSIQSNSTELGNKKVVQCIFRDISERVKSEKELLQTHAAIENSLTPITVVVGTSISYANPTAVKLWGYDHFQEFQSVGPFGLFSEKCHPELKRIQEAVLAQGFYTSRGGELFGKRKDGTEFELAFNRTLFRGVDGQPAGITSSWMDISDLVRLGKEQAQMQAQLMHSSKLASIGMLAAGVAHEINNPMTIIMGNMEYLKSCLEGAGDKTEMLQALEKQGRASERINSIVKGLRTFAKADNDLLGPVDLRQVLDDTLAVCEVIFRKERIRIETTHGPGKFLVEGNAGKLQQVILNLLTNAKDAAHAAEGGGVITVTLKSIDQHVCLEISDNGCGISAEHLPYIFDPFFTTKPQGQGTGLGLSIVYSIVKAMNGTVHVESKVGIGTKLIVTL